MASTTFSGPVNSTNGFSGSVLTVGSASVTTLTGNAVPVNLAKFLAETIQQQLKENSLTKELIIDKREAVAI